MRSVSLQASEIKKKFGRRTIFSGINIALRESDSLAVTGRNGSGKSTLLKILAGLLSPTAGSVGLTVDGTRVAPEDAFVHLGFVAPYLQLYDEFTAWENLSLARRIRGIEAPDGDLVRLLERVGLEARKDDLLRTFSSGMKQRLKYAFALLHRPPVLLLDEPRANLDPEGIAVVYRIIKEQREHGIAVIATNDAEDLTLCGKVIQLDTAGRPGGKAA